MLHAGEIHMLEPWYRQFVIGGPAAFMLPAQGYGDFASAIRQKFTMEISAIPRGPVGPAMRRRESVNARAAPGRS